jgi:hypothetical protein
MNVDIRKGCFYRIYAHFGKGDADYATVIAEGLNLKQMEETFIEKIEELLYSIARYAMAQGQGTIVPSSAHIEPRYYYFIQREGDEERYPVARTTVSMYNGYATKYPGPHFHIPVDEISYRHSFDKYDIPCEDREEFDELYFSKLFEKVNEQLKDEFEKTLQELYVDDNTRVASSIKSALSKYSVSAEIRAELESVIKKLQ